MDPLQARLDAGRTVAGRRERQRGQRKSAIYQAAIELFLEKSFERTTIEDIAERADVSRATVFNYFPRKSAFVDEWASRRREGAFDAALLTRSQGGSLRSALLRYFTELSAADSTHRTETVAMITATMHSSIVWRHSPLALELSAIVSEARDRGAIHASVDSDRVGLLLAGGYYVVLTAWIVQDPAPFDLNDELAAVIDALLHGVPPIDPPAWRRR